MKILSKSNKTLKISIFTLLAACSIIGVSKFIQNAYAVKATDFNAGRIIDDEIFYNKDSMSVQQIQDFLNKQVGSCDTWGTQRAADWGRNDITRAQFAKQRWGVNPPFVCLNNYHENPSTKESSFEKGGGHFEGGLSAAQIIHQAAQKYNINPQVLLVLLRKESQNLTGDKWPLKSQYKYAMGYACPDSGPGFTAACTESKAGFYNQMTLAAWQLKYYKDNKDSYHLRLGHNNIQYSPNPACGTKSVNIENVATLSLYIYTPYTPNEGALTNYPGTSHCGAYGNRNFFMFFNEWFGSTLFTPPTPPTPTPSVTQTVMPTTVTTSILANSGLAVDVPGANFVSGNKLQIWENNGTNAQRFTLSKQLDGSYVIRSHNGKVLDLSGRNTNNGSRIQLYEYNGTCAQKWNIVKKSNGKYKIVSTCDNRKVMDISGGEIRRSGTHIQIWDDNGTQAQEFGMNF